MKNKKTIIALIGFLFVTLSFFFCWFQIRPANARVACWGKVDEGVKSVKQSSGNTPSLDSQEKAFKKCLHSKGF